MEKCVHTRQLIRSSRIDANPKTRLWSESCGGTVESQSEMITPTMSVVLHPIQMRATPSPADSFARRLSLRSCRLSLSHPPSERSSDEPAFASLTQTSHESCAPMNGVQPRATAKSSSRGCHSRGQVSMPSSLFSPQRAVAKLNSSPALPSATATAVERRPARNAPNATATRHAPSTPRAIRSRPPTFRSNILCQRVPATKILVFLTVMPGAAANVLELWVIFWVRES